MKILVLDDDEQLCCAVKGMLTHHGHEVDTVGDARTAVETVKQTPYDFVLVDYFMPDHDGVWFMRNAGLPPETKVLLVTAYVNRQVIDEMFKLGAVGYLIKPFDSDDLLHHLDYFAGK